MAAVRNRWPSASRWEVRSCGRCPHAHLILIDEYGNERALMTVAGHQIDKLAADLRAVVQENVTRSLRSQIE